MKEKFYTIVEHVDKETGEIIEKYSIEQGKYYIIKSQTKYKLENGNYIKKITKECRSTGQYSLF